MATLTYTGELTVTTCWCGIKHAIPKNLARWAKQGERNAVYCPLGHEWVVRQTEADVLRAQLDQAQADARWQRQEKERARAAAEHERNRVKGYQGALAKQRKRAAKGVCPAPGCKRSFVDVAKHVATCHPDLDGGAA